MKKEIVKDGKPKLSSKVRRVMEESKKDHLIQLGQSPTEEK